MSSSILLGQEASRTIVQAKEDQDLRDFNTVIGKGEMNRQSYAAIDIYDCNRLPLLKTKISKPSVPSKAYDTYKMCRDWGLGEAGMLQSTSLSHVDGARAKSVLGGAYRALSIRQIKSRIIKTSEERENENDRLARVLKYMTDAKTIIDSSRLYFEAAVNFQEMEMFERASYCYKKSTKRASAAVVVDTYDLPEDEKYRRHVERMSKFQLPKFMKERTELRNQLIFEEDERQRLRARESHFQLARIHLMTDLVDLPLAHSNIRLAFKCCSNDEEHRDMLLSMHVLMKEFASLRRRELPLVKQIERASQGPIADAHLNVLLELEGLYPNNADVHEWLGYRYTEKCDLEAAQHHFRKLRDILEPVPDMAETLLVWGGTFKVPATSADDPTQKAIDADIRANICKTPMHVISLEGEMEHPVTVSETDKVIADMAQKLKMRQDMRRNQGNGQAGLGGFTPINSAHKDGGLGLGAAGDESINIDIRNRTPSFGAAAALAENAVVTDSNDSNAGSTSINNNNTSTSHSSSSYSAASTETRDLAWFGGKHTDCNTILYKAPLQGWNTLLPSSFARNVPTPARNKNN